MQNLRKECKIYARNAKNYANKRLNLHLLLKKCHKGQELKGIRNVIQNFIINLIFFNRKALKCNKYQQFDQLEH
uniref:Uncharacterized protein n=1 Tax=Rhizophora mucronata TaxID=61149 RepID=A0A2P2QQ21_RHIMU